MKDRKFIWAVRVIEIFKNILEGFVVNCEIKCKVIRGRGAIFFLSEVEKAGVITIIGLPEKLAQSLIDLCAVFQRHKPPVWFDTAVFTNSQKNDTVDGTLHCKV